MRPGRGSGDLSSGRGSIEQHPSPIDAYVDWVAAHANADPEDADPDEGDPVTVPFTEYLVLDGLTSEISVSFDLVM